MARSQRKYDHEYKVQAVKLAKEIAGAKAVAIAPVRCYHKSTTTNTGQEDNSYG